MQNSNLKIKIGIIAMAVIAITTVGLYISKKSNESEYDYYESMQTENESIIDGEDGNDEKTENTILIHITGEVYYPGVVVLKEGDRVVDAIAAAGGETQDANLNELNLAYVLNDGEKIYVPNKNETDNEQEYITSGIGENISSTGSQNKSTKVNINTATLEELTQLPGIGEATANKIIEYRKENGKFKTVEDIKNVAGIGNSKFENIKDLITV